MNFDSLVSVIEQTHTHFQQQAVKAVNVSLTVRNYLIGFYSIEFEQNGEVRATYGAILERISFTHIVELFKIEDKTKRTLYENLNQRC